MSPLPGVTYEEQDAAGSPGPPLDTATAFVVGQAERGPVDRAFYVTSPTAYAAICGGEWAPGYLDDAAQIFSLEGAAGSWFSRVVGPSAKAASAKFSDGSTNTMEVLAANPGEWGNSVKVTVTAVEGGGFTVNVLEGGTQKETERFLTVAEAHTWALNSSYIRINDLGGADPVAAEKTLSGGTDDRSNITDTERKAALARFTADLGPGQVLCPGATTTAMYTALLEHAEANNRIALLDGADTHTVATLTGAAATLRALGHPARCGGLFAPWATGPGPAASTTKVVPYSIVQAALCARRDLATVDGTLGIGNPNSPAAGTYQKAGVSRWATGLSQEGWSDAERETLNNAGVNVARFLYERVITYGYRTLANPTTDALNIWLSNRRLDMAIIAAAEAVGQEFNIRQVDGRGQTLSDFKAALVGRVLLPYLEVGALFESKPGANDAYSVVTDESVNPPDQLADGLVKAVIEAKRSPLAERVKLIYVKEEL